MFFRLSFMAMLASFVALATTAQDCTLEKFFFLISPACANLDVAFSSLPEGSVVLAPCDNALDAFLSDRGLVVGALCGSLTGRAFLENILKYHVVEDLRDGADNLNVFGRATLPTLQGSTVLVQVNHATSTFTVNGFDVLENSILESFNLYGLDGVLVPPSSSTPLEPVNKGKKGGVMAGSSGKKGSNVAMASSGKKGSSDKHNAKRN